MLLILPCLLALKTHYAFKFPRVIDTRALMRCVSGLYTFYMLARAYPREDSRARVRFAPRGARKTVRAYRRADFESRVVNFFEQGSSAVCGRISKREAIDVEIQYRQGHILIGLASIRARVASCTACTASARWSQPETLLLMIAARATTIKE